MFKTRFPALYKHYAATLDFILNENPSLVAPFYPFAAYAVNTGNVVAKPHTDSLNFGPGLCCVIPFGTFDPRQDARLGMRELRSEVEVAPGVPVFFPSGSYTHYNTLLTTMGMRGSIVLWTNASLFQYSDLGGRSVKSLSVEESRGYYASLNERIAQGVSRFPLVFPPQNP